jgi:hypothetical protein
MSRALLVAILPLAILACGKRDYLEAAPAPVVAVAPSASPTPVAAPARAEAVADTDIVTPVDFEDEAEKTITAANYKKEIASLETELAKD